MRRTPTWGQRQRLQALGLNLDDIGRIFNRTKVDDPAPERITVPSTAAELEVMLGDGEKMKGLFANKAAFGEFISNYARTVLDRDQSIATQVREETQRVLADYLREHQPEAIARVNLDPA